MPIVALCVLLQRAFAYHTQLAGLSVDGGEMTPAIFAPQNFEYDVKMPSSMRTATLQIDVDFKQYGNIGSLPDILVNGEKKTYETDKACLVHVNLDEHGDAEDRTDVIVTVSEPTGLVDRAESRHILHVHRPADLNVLLRPLLLEVYQGAERVDMKPPFDSSQVAYTAKVSLPHSDVEFGLRMACRPGVSVLMDSQPWNSDELYLARFFLPPG